MKLSIIIPVYNEEKTILEILNRLMAVNFGIDYEIIVIDDGSTDSTAKVIESGIKNYESRIRVIHQEKNQGKGAALKRGFGEAVGDIIAVQDADLEYNPQDLPKLIKPILDGRADIVYGSRFLNQHQPRYKIFYWGNRFLSWLFKLIFGQTITDPWTGYKVFKKDCLKNISLVSNGFELEMELAAKFIKKGYHILELPISYQSRGYREGKKIKWLDGLKAIKTIFKYSR